MTEKQPKTPSRLIWDPVKKRYFMNPEHPDYRKCVVCGDVTMDCENYCVGCFTCSEHMHTKRCKLSRRYGN